MTIIQLEYFMAVANYGSFSTAAKNCFVTQPSLSMQIQNLEDELGVVLLDRTQKPIAPTETGLVVLEQAKEAVTSFYGTKEMVSSLKGKLAGKVRLGIIPTISPYLLPKFLPGFMKKYPQVELDIRDMMTAELIEALNHDMIDMAILAGGEPVKVREIKLFDDDLYFYVSLKHELYNRREIAIEEVDVKRLLILSEGNCLRNQVLKLMCLARYNVRSQYKLMNCSLETMLHIVDATSAITIIPGMAVEYLPEEKRKQVRPFAKVNAQRKITMAVRQTYVKESLVGAIRKSIMAVADDYALLSYLQA